MDKSATASAKRQQELDFSRGARQGVLERARIPKSTKALLKALEACIRDHQVWFVTIDTIALSMGYGERSVRRAIEQAEKKRLITVSRQNGRCHGYSINWQAVFDLPDASPESVENRGRRPGRPRPRTNKSNPGQINPTPDILTTPPVRMSTPPVRMSGVCHTTHISTHNTTPTNAKNSVEVVEIEGLEKRLLEIGVARARETIDKALSLNYPLATIGAIIDHCVVCPGYWGPGAIVRRLTLASGASIPADQGWPPANPRAIQDQRRTQQIASQRDQSAVEAQASTANRQRQQERERRFGGIVDSLDEDHVLRILDTGQPGDKFLSQAFRRSGPGPLTRSRIMELLEKNPGLLESLGAEAAT